MGKVLANLDNLIRMPYGCGEQNMINFVPNILVMHYLTVTSQGTSKNRDDAVRYMNKGYQRELTYQRSDSSFSAFGDKDHVGSTWLTAFVAKSFHKAKEYITIDTDNIANSIKFILSKQQDDGSFEESGTVHHASLKGGSFQGIPLTAYAVITLKNSDLDNENEFDNAISKARIYLERRLEDMRKDPYALAIVTYALSLAKSQVVPRFFDALDALATKADDYHYWKEADSKEDAHQKHAYHMPRSYEIEMTAYALLAHLNDDRTAYTHAMIKWLVSKQSSHGGFASTQDTVVALEALATYAERFRPSVKGITVSLQADGASHTFDTITRVNAALLQTYTISSDIPTVTLKATGNGLALVQLSMSYSVIPEKEPEPPIKVDVVTDHSNENEVVVNVCAKWLKNVPSGMANIDVSALSGYDFDINGLMKEENIKKGLKKVEVKGKIVATYWEELTSEETCISITTYKVQEVANLQEARVTAYAYYSPDAQASELYLPADFASDNESNRCRLCPSCCKTDPEETSGAAAARAGYLLLVITAVLTCILRM